METKLILLTDYCDKSSMELEFIISLENEGLLQIETIDTAKYIKESQLEDLEIFRRLHYDLAVNIEGIDIIHNMLGRMREMQRELALLKRRHNEDFDASFFEFDDDFFAEIF